MARLPLWPSYIVRAAALGYQGREETTEAMQDLKRLTPNVTRSYVDERFTLMIPPYREKLLQGLALAGMPE